MPTCYHREAQQRKLTINTTDCYYTYYIVGVMLHIQLSNNVGTVVLLNINNREKTLQYTVSLYTFQSEKIRDIWFLN